MSEITETLTLLQQAGHTQYMKWQLSFDCSQYKTTDVQTLSRQMGNELRMWKEHVMSQRKKFYELNYFTAEQVLLLRKELKNTSCVKPDVVALLHAVSPHHQSKLQSAIQTSQVKTSPQIVRRNVTKSLVVQTDEAADSKYLNLEDLGTVLNGLPPGMYRNSNIISLKINIWYLAVVLEKRRPFAANLKAGFPNLLVVEPGEYQSYE